ncbi:MAG: hypothetical protein O2943_07730 [Actinomycetota bacterium]|nr:hypothetical protein [Actinomycetota bacterium]
MTAEPANITQRQLPNDIGAILRAVEAGAQFAITNNGRPVCKPRRTKKNDPRSLPPAHP